MSRDISTESTGLPCGSPPTHTHTHTTQVWDPPPHTLPHSSSPCSLHRNSLSSYSPLSTLHLNILPSSPHFYLQSVSLSLVIPCTYCITSLFSLNKHVLLECLDDVLCVWLMCSCDEVVHSQHPIPQYALSTHDRVRER